MQPAAFHRAIRSEAAPHAVKTDHNSLMNVVTVHFGDQRHVAACLRETAKHNRDVLLIGDESNEHMAREVAGVQWVDAAALPLSPKAALLRRHFVNYSTNAYRFELNCFLRMFYVRALLEKLGSGDCFHIDSDCALLADVSAISYETADALTLHNDFGNPVRMTASVHNARLTRDFLERFMQLCLDVFVDGTRLEDVVPKIEQHAERGLPGGVCDMTLYHLVTRGRIVQDLGTPREGAVFDHRFGSPEGHELERQYEMTDGHKRLTRGDGGFYIHDVRGSAVRLLSIHFQGIAKRFVDLLSATAE
jgi:hypothetical protein